MARTYVKIELDKTEFDIMCNCLDITLFGRNDLKTRWSKFFGLNLNTS